MLTRMQPKWNEPTTSPPPPKPGCTIDYRTLQPSSPSKCDPSATSSPARSPDEWAEMLYSAVKPALQCPPIMTGPSSDD